MKNIETFLGKNWKTNLLGIVIIAGLGYNIFVRGIEVENIENVLGLLMAIGFFATKDGDASHSRELRQEIENLKKDLTDRGVNSIVGERPKDRE